MGIMRKLARGCIMKNYLLVVLVALFFSCDDTITPNPNTAPVNLM
jgi:hypothetical protein